MSTLLRRSERAMLRIAWRRSYSVTPVSAWQQKRLDLWDAEKCRQQKLLNQAAEGTGDDADGREIKLLVQRGKKKGPKELLFAKKENVTPNDLVKVAGGDGPIGALCRPQNSNSDSATVVGMDDALNDIGDCSVQMISANDADVNANVDVHVKEAAQSILWHSAAHVLGQAAENILSRHIENDLGGNGKVLDQQSTNVLLCDGPPLVDGSVEGGFFYEMSLPKGFTIREEKFFPELEAEMGRILSDKQNFEKLHVSKDFAAKMFSYNPFKLDMLEQIPET